MSEFKQGEMIAAPNALFKRVGGGRVGAIDPAAIAKAEAALKSLSGNFGQWLNDEVAKLEEFGGLNRIANVSKSTDAIEVSTAKVRPPSRMAHVRAS